MIPLSDRSTIQRYTPKNTDVRITTTVVATTSFWLGHVTRPISLRTSERKRRERPHHPVTLSRARPPNESCSSAVTVFIDVVRGLQWRSGLSAPRLSSLHCAAASPARSAPLAILPVSAYLLHTGRTGGNRTPNPRVCRPVSITGARDRRSLA